MKNLDPISPNPNKNRFGRPPIIQKQPAGDANYNTQSRLSKSVREESRQGLGISDKVNLLKPAARAKPKSLLKRVVLILGVIVLILGGLVLNRAAQLSEKIFAGQTTTFFGKIWEALRGASGQISLRGENQGQINILLLGIGGPGHDGPYLSDTMILAQIRPQTSEVAFISIPRDTLAELPGNLGFRKINAVFAEGFARTKNWSEAGRWSRMAVERLSGQTIPYFAVIDFKGFKKAADEIGGLDINVEKTFTDREFPDEKSGYLPPITFEAGLQHMDGTRALEYSRSRHGDNNEGNDFARGLRQQKVMKAFKDKIFKLNLITSSGRINKLLGIFADNFHTNLTPGEIFRLYDLAKERNIQTFLSLNLGLETSLLCPTIQEETAAYILVLCAGKTSEDLRDFFKNAFVFGKLSQEKAIVWLADSTQTAQKYKQAEDKLKAAGLAVWQLTYSKDDLPQSIVYQVNSKPATAEYIKNILKAKEVSLPPPEVKVDKEKVDVIVILGKNNY